MKSIVSTIIFLLISILVIGQNIQPGFSKTEYVELLKIAARQVNIPSENIKSPMPDSFRQIYRSQEMGFHNQWDLWVGANNTAVIGIRGTTKEITSWMANFYAVMVPAKGKLQ